MNIIELFIALGTISIGTILFGFLVYYFGKRYYLRRLSADLSLAFYFLLYGIVTVSYTLELAILALYGSQTNNSDPLFIFMMSSILISSIGLIFFVKNVFMPTSFLFSGFNYVFLFLIGFTFAFSFDLQYTVSLVSDGQIECYIENPTPFFPLLGILTFIPVVIFSFFILKHLLEKRTLPTPKDPVVMGRLYLLGIGSLLLVVYSVYRTIEAIGYYYNTIRYFDFLILLGIALTFYLGWGMPNFLVQHLRKIDEKRRN